MDQPNQPLAERLKKAALARSLVQSERVDDFVLDNDGVIDLRVLDRQAGDISIAAPAAALAGIRGQFGDAGEVANLYADERQADDEPRRLGLRARLAAASDGLRASPRPAPKQPTRSDAIPRTAAPPLFAEPVVTEAAPPPAPPSTPFPLGSHDPIPWPAGGLRDEEPPALPRLSRIDSGILHQDPSAEQGNTVPLGSATPPDDLDLRREDRGISDCPQCLGNGRLDLFDRVSQTEYYSCDDCMHMWQRDRN